MHLILKLALAGTALALAAGCENQSPRPKTTQGPAGEASAGNSAPAQASKKDVSPEDAELTSKVKSAFASDPAVRDTDIQIASNAGVVVLKGQVETDETKQRIQQLAQEVPGVKWVQNQISVAPPPKAG